MRSARFGTLALGIALVVVLGAVALPLALPPPEEGGPSLPWDNPLVRPPPEATPPAQDPPDDPPAGDYDAHLTVWSATGPFTDEPRPIDRRLFSTNIWYTNGWYNNLNESWLTMLKAIQPGSLRWPSGHPGQSYCFEMEPGKPYPSCDGWLLPRSQFDQFIAVSHEVGAEPLVAINVKRGSPEMAAAMVRYANVEKGYDIKYWHLGNEPDLGNDMNNVRRFIEVWSSYSEAMRAVDASIKLVGPEMMTGSHVMGTNGRPDLVRQFLEANPGTVDAVSWHLYPLDSENGYAKSPAYPSVRNLMSWYTPDWMPTGIRFVDLASDKLRNDTTDLMPGAEIWVTELGPDSGEPGAKGITDGQVAAVWFADVLGRFGERGTHAVYQFAFDHWSSKDELSLVVRPPNGGYDPLPPWYTYWLYAEHWGDRVVKTTSTDDGNVSAHASLRPDGKLALVLVNKAEDERSARLTLREFGRVASAETYTLSADSPTSLEANVNGVRIDPRRFDETTSQVRPSEGIASTDAIWTLAPYTVTFLVLTPEP